MYVLLLVFLRETFKHSLLYSRTVQCIVPENIRTSPMDLDLGYVLEQHNVHVLKFVRGMHG